MARKKTNEEFIKEVYDLVGDEYAFLEEYKGVNIRIKCKHIKCGYEWVVLPTNFLRGSRCPKCAGNARPSYEDVKKHIEIESGSGCKLISTEYKNAYSELDIQCPCGNIFTLLYTGFRNAKKHTCKWNGFYTRR